MSNLIAGTVTATTAVKAGSLQDAAGANPSTPQEIQQGRVKAWFNLNGTGTIAARDSFGISSFVDNGVGSYAAVYATARPNANGAIALAVGNTPSGNGIIEIYTSSAVPSVNGFAMVSLTPSAGAAQDTDNIHSEMTGD